MPPEVIGVASSIRSRRRLDLASVGRTDERPASDHASEIRSRRARSQSAARRARRATATDERPFGPREARHIPSAELPLASRDRAHAIVATTSGHRGELAQRVAHACADLRTPLGVPHDVLAVARELHVRDRHLHGAPDGDLMEFLGDHLSDELASLVVEGAQGEGEVAPDRAHASRSMIGSSARA